MGKTKKDRFIDMYWMYRDRGLSHQEALDMFPWVIKKKAEAAVDETSSARSIARGWILLFVVVMLVLIVSLIITIQFCWNS